MNCRPASPRSGGALLLLWFFLAVGIGLSAGPERVADIRVTPGQVTWSPYVKAEKWLLTVSGPGIYLREVVESGEPLRLQSAAPDGERLADGIYIWELRAIRPERRESIAERDHKPEFIRERSARRDVTFERRPVEQPVVTSGAVRVEGGAFVILPPEEAGERR